VQLPESRKGMPPEILEKFEMIPHCRAVFWAFRFSSKEFVRKF